MRDPGPRLVPEESAAPKAPSHTDKSPRPSLTSRIPRLPSESRGATLPGSGPRPHRPTRQAAHSAQVLTKAEKRIPPAPSDDSPELGRTSRLGTGVRKPHKGLHSNTRPKTPIMAPGPRAQPERRRSERDYKAPREGRKGRRGRGLGEERVGGGGRDGEEKGEWVDRWKWWPTPHQPPPPRPFPCPTPPQPYHLRPQPPPFKPYRAQGKVCQFQ